MRPVLTMLAVLSTHALAGSAHADGSNAHSYAVVVGSNPGGEGQQTLRFAESDARNVASVLRDLGGYREGDIALLRGPSPDALISALDRVGERIRRDATEGVQSVLFFYYSGHSKAHALNLGQQELPLATLRQKIMSLPATLKIVVLDACQSGAFSNIKGVERAADFSYNSVSRLNSAGVAVMASSSGTELSQESARLGASYFTHHLLVALRGAGDTNKDGRVSLDEAYRYAYGHTLETTAKTSVGRQHVTLETDLKGKGEIALTYPRKPDAILRLPTELVARVLVQQRRGGAVMADVSKSHGPMELTLPSGDYRVLATGEKSAHQCNVELRRGKPRIVFPSTCPKLDLTAELTKGGGQTQIARAWSLEAGAGPSSTIDDAYVGRLDEFGYEPDSDSGTHYSLSGVFRFHRNFAVVANISGLGRGRYARRKDTEVTKFQWNTTSYGALMRAQYPLAPFFKLFAEAGAGLAHGSNSIQIGGRMPTRESQWGYALIAGAGVQIDFSSHVGIFVRGSIASAPVMTNLIGDTHDGGGTFFALGWRLFF